jgi:hypothetical protein
VAPLVVSTLSASTVDSWLCRIRSRREDVKELYLGLARTDHCTYSVRMKRNVSFPYCARVLRSHF